MGYESKVTIVLRKTDCDEMAEKLLNTCNRKLTDVFKRAGVFETSDETYICLQTDWVKWYEDDEYFPDVNLIMNYIKDVRHSYIRYGENYEDIEFDFKDEDKEGTDGEFRYLIEPLVDIRGMDQFDFNRPEDVLENYVSPDGRYIVPVTYKMYSTVEVTGVKNLKEAIELAKKNANNIPLGQGEYIDDSYEIAVDNDGEAIDAQDFVHIGEVEISPEKFKKE